MTDNWAEGYAAARLDKIRALLDEYHNHWRELGHQPHVTPLLEDLAEILDLDGDHQPKLAMIPRPRVYLASPDTPDRFNIDCPACHVRDEDNPKFALACHTVGTARTISSGVTKAHAHLATAHNNNGGTR